jgi:tRNA (cmo5U34)-methyltransferase
MELEKMSDFFNHRVNEYEEHMQKNVKGTDQFYYETAKLIPQKPNFHLLDLGCGTGLELDEIFKTNPQIKVTCIDLAKDMMAKIKEKHPDKLQQLTLIVDNYLTYDLGKKQFDAAVSVETMHHFTHEEKIALYQKISASLKPDGFYIETDFIAPDQNYEDYHYRENRRLRTELGITTSSDRLLADRKTSILVLVKISISLTVAL